MTIHNVKAGNGNIYDIYLGQYSYNEIVVDIKNVSYKDYGTMYVIPVKAKAGFAWKVTKTAIWCTSGNAADILKLFNEFNSFGIATIKELILNNPNKQRFLA